MEDIVSVLVYNVRLNSGKQFYRYVYIDLIVFRVYFIYLVWFFVYVVFDKGCG